MGLLADLVFERRGLEKSFVESPADWLVAMFGGRSMYSGLVVTPNTAMQAAAVFACVRTSATTMGSLPLKVYRSYSDGSKEPAPEHPLYPLLHDAPNPEQTAMSFREMGQAHLLLRGNFYAEIDRNPYEQIRALWPLHPDRVRIDRPRAGGPLVYWVTVPSVSLSAPPPGSPIQRPHEVALPAANVLHVKGLSVDGVQGLSPIQVAAESIGLALATEAYGAKFFGSGANPGGVIQRPREAGSFKNPETITRLREQWEDLYGGLSQAHRVAILEDGMTWQQIGIPNNHAQFLETRQHQTGDIASIFGIPGVMIGYADKTATYASTEQFFLHYTVHHVTPHAVRWEQAIKQRCLSAKEQALYFVAFTVDGLLRGAAQDRWQVYALGRQWGIYNADEIREKENMNPQPDGQGKKYWAPVNMVPADQLGQAPSAPPAVPSREAILRTLLMDGARRLVHQEIETVRKERSRDGHDPEAWRTWVAQFYARHAARLAERLHVSLDAARTYTEDHRAELLATGLAALDQWEHGAPLALVALALDDLRLMPTA